MKNEANIAGISKSIKYTKSEIARHSQLGNDDIVENLESELYELEYQLGELESE
jgi:hypothetical protein